MTYDQLVEALKTLGINTSNEDRNYRASLYLDYLQDTKIFLTETLQQTKKGIGAEAFKFCKTALKASNLIQDLADILDHYSCPPLEGTFQVVKTYTYKEYFEARIFGTSDKQYKKNLKTFRSDIPISAHAIKQLTSNFQNNIKTACQRIYSDRALIETCYEDLYDELFTIDSLKKISGTGSDFHKGGQQVLILTFAASDITDHLPIPAVNSYDFKVVYKPGDLEADCLLAGNSAVVNKVLGKNFMVNSLFEIYNAQLPEIKNDDPDFAGLPLKTYRFIPRNYQSQRGTSLRDAYGYLEYLDNDVYGNFQSIHGYYPFADSDFIIFKSELKNEKKIVGDFYKRAGAMSALACTFSIVDLHLENIRVMTRDPYFIDMEVCLTREISNIENTSLLAVIGAASIGGINGINHDSQDSYFYFSGTDTRDNIFINEQFIDRYYQNRLWRVSENGQRQVIDVDRVNYAIGLKNGLRVIQAAQENNEFTTWFSRLSGVVVRTLPYATKDLISVSKNIYIFPPQITKQMATPVATKVTDAVRQKLTEGYKAYIEADSNTALPKFIVLDQKNSGNDFLALDIPIFYHRIGTTEIMNSLGQTIPVPNTMEINTTEGGTERVRIKNAAVSRARYFPTGPTASIVKKGQVQILTDEKKFKARERSLRNDIATFFTDNPGNAATIFKPIQAKGEG